VAVRFEPDDEFDVLVLVASVGERVLDLQQREAARGFDFLLELLQKLQEERGVGELEGAACDVLELGERLFYFCADVVE